MSRFFEVTLNGTRSRVRLLSGALSEAERRTLLLSLKAIFASGANSVELSQAEVLAAGGPLFSYNDLGKIGAVALEYERPSGSYGFLPLFGGLNVTEDTRLEVSLYRLNDELRAGLGEALRRGVL